MRCTGFPYERTWYELDTKAHDRNFLLLLFSVNIQDSVSYSYIDPSFLNLKKNWSTWSCVRWSWGCWGGSSGCWGSSGRCSGQASNCFRCAGWNHSPGFKHYYESFLSYSSNGPCPKYKVASAVPAKPEKGCSKQFFWIKASPQRDLIPPLQSICHAIVLPEPLRSERKEKWEIQMV